VKTIPANTRPRDDAVIDMAESNNLMRELMCNPKWVSESKQRMVTLGAHPVGADTATPVDDKNCQI
jgi:hypothetical protein